MIEVENLTKYYGTKIALDKVSFSVREGEILGLLGPNGAGKSTSMKIITGYLSPTEGTVKVDGLDIVENSLEVRKRIGYLPENPPLYLDMTVKNYLEFAGSIKGVGRKQLKECVNTVVDKCSISKYYNSQCKSLSKGFRQRVGIAQAMIHNPKLLILDEPTIGLDPIQIIEIRNLIKSFGGEHTVILSTHILPEVEMTCERVIIINDGKVVTQDSTANLKSRIPNKGQISLKIAGDASSFESTLKELEGVTAVKIESATPEITVFSIESKKSDIRPDVARLVISNNYNLLELKTFSMTLEEVFIKVTMN